MNLVTRIARAFAVASILLAWPALAEVASYGTSRCSEFTKAFVDDPERTRASALAWIDGFWVGMNTHTAAAILKTEETSAAVYDSDELFLRLALACKRRPESDLASETLKLFSRIRPPSPDELKKMSTEELLELLEQ